MANNQYKNKVVYAGTTLIDLTGDDVTAADVAQGKKFHLPSGEQSTGTMTGGAVIIEDTVDSHGGTIREITATDVVHLQNAKAATPTESAQVITPDSGYDALASVNVGAISSTYVGSGITRRSSTDLSASGATVTAPAGYYASSASKAVASGSAGTPTATKGSVSNHSISVTPSVTNTSGYITGSTKTGTAVTVSASELVSGSQTITQNGTVNVTNLAEVVVDVAGGGGSSMQIGQKDVVLSSASSSITFTGLAGEPTSFSLLSDDTVNTSATPTVVAMAFDGTNLHAQTITNTSNAQVTYDGTNFSKTYSNGTLTITCTGSAVFGALYYYLDYTYGGSAANIHTENVQVGSGATSITFTGLDDEPVFWTCIFKSNFGTSSGYQRVIFVRKNETNVCGASMASSTTTSSSYWTASYSNGSLTISSAGTNQGGYWHQPGYYQLTYAIADESPYQKKTVTPTTSQQVITADEGYEALGQVTVNAMPSGSVTAPSSISGTAATVSTGTNTLTLTKTVSVTPNVTAAGYVSSGTAGNASVSLQASVTTQGAKTVTPSTSQQTAVSSGTYVTGNVVVSAIASGTAGTPTATKGTVSNHSISVTPSVTNTTGYITGGTKSGTAVTVTASELASGNKAITENGTNIDVVGYSTVSVAVPSGGAETGTFTITAANSTAQVYIGYLTLVPFSTSYIPFGYYPIRSVTYQNSGSGSISGRWFKDTDGYMYVYFSGSNNYYPVITATSGTATLIAGDTTGGKIDNHGFKDAFTIYKVSDGAVLSASYRDNS